jgi:AraC family transcriptional regulator
MSIGLGRIHGVAEVLAERSSAVVNLGVISADGAAPEHAHANPYLWLYLMGGYREAGDVGEQAVDGPAAIYFPAGSTHRMSVHEQGLAAVIVEFDPDWLRRSLGPGADLGRPRLWAGGEVGRRASALARLWLAEPACDAERFALTETFLGWALGATQLRSPPPWLGDLEALIEDGATARRTQEMARRLGVSAPWLARAYRHWRGEGLAEAQRRRRIEAASALLEAEHADLADVAAAAGFCDQSHMSRAFRHQLGRTPAQVRARPFGLTDRSWAAS